MGAGEYSTAASAVRPAAAEHRSCCTRTRLLSYWNKRTSSWISYMVCSTVSGPGKPMWNGGRGLFCTSWMTSCGETISGLGGLPFENCAELTMELQQQHTNMRCPVSTEQQVVIAIRSRPPQNTTGLCQPICHGKINCSHSHASLLCNC